MGKMVTVVKIKPKNNVHVDRPYSRNQYVTIDLNL